MNFGTVKPSFIIIGVQKGGTTSLHKYLLQHPQLIAPKPKELHCFDNYNTFNAQEYLAKFPKKYFSNCISFESTPRYLYHPACAKKLYDFNPHLKFIVVLRHPVERAYSAWNMYKLLSRSPQKTDAAKFFEKANTTEKLYSYFYKNNFPSFHDWVTFEISGAMDSTILEPSIVKRGYYKEQIERYFKLFSKEQFLFIDSNELKNNTLQSLELVAGFLNIKSFNKLKLNLKKSHQIKYEEKMKDETYTLLLKHFQKKNEGLGSLIGLELDWLKSK
ncbi:sulfotransferase domain-containing protein [Marixanthomonas ophiurae]|uniref:Sulfotransferase domain-containing protein n=1 Tax=Marixanthomonas ophiurae TaxID=387659 RepID=A0A3E1QD61_9FLAO|nr:sulfotransferase domain-containing protein [Marixanthomonas ophiurae]RFN60034.1 hypothetical protein DZ858_08295 [Marixanthomonas ophiurae]